MSGNRILWGQITVVFAVVLATIWGATQWTAWRLGFQPQLGAPWFELAGRAGLLSAGLLLVVVSPTTPMRRSIFVEGAFIAASGGFISIAVAIGMSVWRAREAKNVETYGSARWATKEEIQSGRLARPGRRGARPLDAATISATTVRSMCCALRRPDPARASAWSCRRC